MYQFDMYFIFLLLVIEKQHLNKKCCYQIPEDWGRVTLFQAKINLGVDKQIVYL